MFQRIDRVDLRSGISNSSMAGRFGLMNYRVLCNNMLHSLVQLGKLVTLSRVEYFFCILLGEGEGQGHVGIEHDYSMHKDCCEWY